MVTQEQVIENLSKKIGDIKVLSDYKKLCDCIVEVVGKLNEVWRLPDEEVSVEKDLIGWASHDIPGVDPKVREVFEDRMAFYRTMNNARLLSDAITVRIAELVTEEVR